MCTEGDITAGAEAPNRVSGQAPQAKYRDVFAVPEFRALWGAQLVSVIGDQLARVALTVLVYKQTSSALLAAVTFMLSVVPVFVGGVTLAWLADRFPRRRVMIACDVFRCLLVAVMALPRMPLALLVALLAIVTLVGAPFTAARASIYPDVLAGDRYVAGTAITLTTNQFAQVIGFALSGAAVALLGTRTSLVIDAATFALSGVIVACWVRARPAPAPRRARPAAATDVGSGAAPAGGSGAAADAGSGAAADAGSGAAPDGAEGDGPDADGRLAGAVRAVFGTPVLLLPMLFGWLAAFYNSPEGVAAPLARSLGGGAAAVGAILAAQALGETAGMLLYGRLMRPQTRLRLMGPLAIATCGVLTLFFARPGFAATLIILVASGAFGAYQIAANAAFVRAVPAHWRARAFGLAQGGMSLGQGTVLVLAGAAAQRFAPATVIAVAGAVGTVCAAGVAAGWLRARKQDEPEGL